MRFVEFAVKYEHRALYINAEEVSHVIQALETYRGAALSLVKMRNGDLFEVCGKPDEVVGKLRGFR